MTAFPKRFSRSALGPKFVNTNAPENPEGDIGAETFNPAFHAVAGMNLITPRAVLIGSINGAGQNILHQAESWNPDSNQSHPTLARTSIGSYTYTFAANYLDEDGVSVPTVLLAARVNATVDLPSGFTNRNFAFAWIDPANALRVQLRFWDSVGAGIDVPFWLEVF